MTDKLPIQGIRPASEPSSQGASKTTPDGGAQFRALLDRLQEETRGLQERSESLSDPVDLAGAVDQARTTIADARSLGDQLLEAYRAARQTASEDGGQA